MQSLQSALLPHIQTRQHQLVSEFSFWPSSPPRDSGYKDGGVFEMRTYRLHPGKLLEWESAWRRGLEARRKFVVSLALAWVRSGCVEVGTVVLESRGCCLCGCIDVKRMVTERGQRLCNPPDQH
jgi:hypothetical protein